MVSLNSRVKWPLTRGITKTWKWRFKLTFVWNCWHNYSLLWVIMTRTHSVLPALLTTLLLNSTFLLFSSSTKVFCFKLKLDISINPFLSSSLPTHPDIGIRRINFAHRIWPLITSGVLSVTLSLLSDSSTLSLHPHQFQGLNIPSPSQQNFFRLHCKLGQCFFLVYIVISLSFAARWPLYLSKPITQQKWYNSHCLNLPRVPNDQTSIQWHVFGKGCLQDFSYSLGKKWTLSKNHSCSREHNH